jgi:hypothetical protein
VVDDISNLTVGPDDNTLVFQRKDYDVSIAVVVLQSGFFGARFPRRTADIAFLRLSPNPFFRVSIGKITTFSTNFQNLFVYSNRGIHARPVIRHWAAPSVEYPRVFKL